jgi:hypothetical protein
MKLDKPYCAEDIPLMLALAFGGLLAIRLLYFTSWDHRLCMLLALVSLGICYFPQYTQRQRNQANRPALWQEMKLGLLVAALIAPIAFGWLYWIGRMSIDSPGASGSVLFFIGAALTIFGAIDRNRRSYIVAGMSLTGFGLAYPWLSLDQVAIGGAIGLIVMGLGGAGVIWWQLKRDAADDLGSDQA